MDKKQESGLATELFSNSFGMRLVDSMAEPMPLMFCLVELLHAELKLNEVGGVGEVSVTRCTLAGFG